MKTSIETVESWFLGHKVMALDLYFYLGNKDTQIKKTFLKVERIMGDKFYFFQQAYIITRLNFQL